MKYILTTAALIASIAFPAFAGAPAGASAMQCDINRFTPIMSADGERILYWNNPTCVNMPSDERVANDPDAHDHDHE